MPPPDFLGTCKICGNPAHPGREHPPPVAGAGASASSVASNTDKSKSKKILNTNWRPGPANSDSERKSGPSGPSRQSQLSTHTGSLSAWNQAPKLPDLNRLNLRGQQEGHEIRSISSDQSPGIQSRIQSSSGSAGPTPFTLDRKYTITPSGLAKPPDDKDIARKVSTAATTVGPRSNFNVVANYVGVKKFPTVLYEYKIVITQRNDKPPGYIEIGRAEERQRILDELASQAPLQGKEWAHNLIFIWSTTPLSVVPETSADAPNVRYQKSNGFYETTRSIAFEFSRQLNYHGANDILLRSNGPPLDADARDEIHRKTVAFNALISRSVLKEPMNTVTIAGGNKFYLDKSFTNLGKGPLGTVRGYFFSIRPGAKQLLLNINASTAAFFPAMQLSEFYALMIENGVSARALQKMLVGVSVSLTYLRPPREDGSSRDDEISRSKTIRGFGANAIDQDSGANGQKVADWFATNHIGAPQFRSNLPCVNIGSAQHSQWIPPELLEIKIPQGFHAVLPANDAESMLKASCRSPTDNLTLIAKEGMVNMGIRAREDGVPCAARTHLLTAGFDLDQNLLSIEARTLRPPTIQYHPANGKLIPDNASWNLSNVHFLRWPKSTDGLTLKPAPKFRVGILQLPVASEWRKKGSFVLSQDDLESFRKVMAKVLMIRGASHLNWDVELPPANLPQTGQVGADDIGSFYDGIVKFFDKFTTWTNVLSILVIVIPHHDYDIYAALKSYLDGAGIASVCVVAGRIKSYNKISRKVEVMNAENPYLSNVALKVCLKTKGQPHRLDRKISEIIGPNCGASDVLLLGADVTHPSKGTSAKFCPSISAVVGSLDDEGVRYGGSMRLQSSRQEMIEDPRRQIMFDMVKERLKAFLSNTRKLPSKIIYFRDGVSETQYEDVKAVEIKAIEQAWRAAPEQYRINAKLQVVCLVVTKRHNTRIFATQEREMVGGKGQNRNLKPGVLVDSVITSPEDGDFFLQSHNAILGTARPAHYTPLRNDMRLPKAKLEELAHALCYTLGTATKGISYCTPAYLADRLCDRGRSYLRDFLMNRHHDVSQLLGVTQNENETQDNFAARLAGILERNEYFNGFGSHHPWHSSLDDRMFWI